MLRSSKSRRMVSSMRLFGQEAPAVSAPVPEAGQRFKRGDLLVGGFDHFGKSRIDGHDEQISQVNQKLLRELLEIGSRLHRLTQGAQRQRRVMVPDRPRPDEEELASHDSQGGADRVQRHAGRPAGENLVEQRHTVAHRAVALAGDEEEGVVVRRKLLLVDDVSKARGRGPRPQAGEIEPLTPGEDRLGHLQRLGGRKDKYCVRWRFLESLQKRVEGIGGEHVNFVDDVDLARQDGRRVAHSLPQLPDVIDAAVGGAVDFDDVHRIPTADRSAGGTVVARFFHGAALTVDRLGEDARHRGLAHAARAGEEVSMGSPAGLERVGKGLRNMRLTHHVVKSLGPVLQGEDEIGHERLEWKTGRLAPRP
jgi:hypothetical protein